MLNYLNIEFSINTNSLDNINYISISEVTTSCAKRSLTFNIQSDH